MLLVGRNCGGEGCSSFMRLSVMDVFLVFLILCLSGNRAFIAPDRFEFVMLLSAFFLLSMFVFRGRRPLTRTFLLVSVGFLLVFGGHVYHFGFFPVTTVGGFYIKLFVAFAVISLVNDFLKTYVYAMFFISLISFVFYVPDQYAHLLGEDMRWLFLPVNSVLGIPAEATVDRINIGIYNFQVGEHATRNAAFFWEPGVFSGYLMLAIIFLSTCRHRMSARNVRLILFVLVVAVLTTQSTAGIVVLPLALMLFVKFNFTNFRSSVRTNLILVVCFITLFIFAFVAAQFDFVGYKIVTLFEQAVNMEAGWQLSRFGAMFFDWPYIQSHPLVGWGQNDSSQYLLNQELDRFALGNGMTGFLRQMGLLGMAIFLFSLWGGLRRFGLEKFHSAYIIFLVLLILNGEYFLLYPLFMGLMFLSPQKGSWVQPFSRRVNV